MRLILTLFWFACCSGFCCCDDLVCVCALFFFLSFFCFVFSLNLETFGKHDTFIHPNTGNYTEEFYDFFEETDEQKEEEEQEEEETLRRRKHHSMSPMTHTIQRSS